MSSNIDNFKKKTDEYNLIASDPLQVDFESKFDKVKKEVDALQAEYTRVLEEYSDVKYRFTQASYFYIKLKRQSDSITEFYNSLWRALVEKVTVYSKERITVTFRDGTEI